MKRIGVSGGTAPFFSLKLINPKEGQNSTYYIGKDLSRATDEVSFYEQVKSSSVSRDALGGVVEFLFPYLGILKTQEVGADAGDDVDLLVLQNLHDGKEKLRLLDIKMGEKTASANWQGKSRLRAFKQRMFDQITNSAVEGYRLEGFDGSPPGLNSMETFMESMSEDKSSKTSKKSRRMLFQSLNGDEILRHLLDLHIGPEESEETYSTDEYLEIVMHEILKLLIKLSVCCDRVKVPQKWIGSSLAIGFDSGALPHRSMSEDEIRSGTIVRIFDWGRSELNNTEKMQELSDQEVKDRRSFWADYRKGVHTLSWIATKTYYNRFCCREWDMVTFTVYDFDALSDDDFMCEATVALKDVGRSNLPLTRKSGKDGGSLSYSIEWKPATSKESRLLGSWKVHIYEGKDLPNKDVSLKNNGGTSDPYVVVKAKSNDQLFSFNQMTTVIQENVNPVFNETLSIPVAVSSEACRIALEYAGLNRSNTVVSDKFEEWVTRVESSTMTEAN